MSEFIMKTYETKKQLNIWLTGLRLTGRTAIVVFAMLLICAGSTTCMVTHGLRYTKYSQCTNQLFDGRIVENEIAEDTA